jgi:hypothetical protein
MAAYALYLNWRRTSITIREDKEKQLEKKKEKIRVERTKQMGGTKLKDVLVIKNKGKAPAKNISIRFENRQGETNPIFSEVPSTLSGGDSVSVDMIIHKGTAPPYNVTITWDDEYKIGNIYETLVN